MKYFDHGWKNILIKTISLVLTFYCELPWRLRCKESACNAGDPGLIPSWEDLLGKGMSTHSSILAWKIPWTEEAGEL